MIKKMLLAMLVFAVIVMIPLFAFVADLGASADIANDTMILQATGPPTIETALASPMDAINERGNLISVDSAMVGIYTASGINCIDGKSGESIAAVYLGPADSIALGISAMGYG